MAKAKREDTILKLGTISFLLISLLVSALIASKLVTIGNYSSLISKANQISSAEEMIQNANEIEVKSNKIIATFKEGSKCLLVDYNLETYEIVKMEKSISDIRSVLCSFLAIVIFIGIDILGLFVLEQISDFRIQKKS